MSKADQVREHAAYVRSNPNNAQAIAAALELIADAMDGKPCEDCASRQGAVIDPDDNPEAGQDGDNVNAGA